MTGKEPRLIDVGGGRGDLAVNIVRWARRVGRPVRVVVVDGDAATLALARRHIAEGRLDHLRPRMLVLRSPHFSRSV